MTKLSQYGASKVVALAKKHDIDNAKAMHLAQDLLEEINTDWIYGGDKD